jgi:uncharacterized protein
MIPCYRQILKTLSLTLIGYNTSFAATNDHHPSFSCNQANNRTIEKLICQNNELSALDRKLSGVYAAAVKKATNEHPPLLKAEQIGWIKGRNECSRSTDREACIREYYLLRIAELQARYQLVPSFGPVGFHCDGNASHEINVTFFKTDPPSLIAERGDSSSTMFQQASISGTKYQGRNESFREQQGEILITWGFNSLEMHCKKAHDSSNQGR